MFDSVLGRGPAAKGRFGTGTLISVVMHGGLLAGALWITSRPAVTRPPERPYVMYGVISKAASPQPATRDVRPTRLKPHSQHPPALVMPPRIEPPQKAEEEPLPPDDAEGSEVLPDDPGKGELGVPGTPGGDPNGMPGGQSNGTAVLDFVGGMTRPVQLQGRDPQYTREALEAHVEGTMIARCVITIEGSLEQCQIIKGLPHMNDAVLGALASRRYQPVTFQGHAVAVKYTFNIRLMLPGR